MGDVRSAQPNSSPATSNTIMFIPIGLAVMLIFAIVALFAELAISSRPQMTWESSQNRVVWKSIKPESADTFADRWLGQKLPVSESAWTARWSAGNE
jgi:hypothetical protein